LLRDQDFAMVTQDHFESSVQAFLRAAGALRALTIPQRFFQATIVKGDTSNSWEISATVWSPFSRAALTALCCSGE
jgi:hypothetical protein